MRGRNKLTERLQLLKQEAVDLEKILKRQARRPFVLEITGTPKAGKTTLISLVEGFLRDAGWRVHILTERAGACPLPMKGHFLFNTWTSGTMLAGLIDAVDRDVDLVILDRGVFDALIWLEIQNQQGQVSRAEVKAFEAFVMLERWRSFSDATCTITVDPQLSMERENQRRLLPRTGSVMNERSLPQFNAALKALMEKHRGDFKFVRLTNAGTAEDGAADLINQILRLARVWADPLIAVIPKDRAQQLVPKRVLPWTARTWSTLSERLTFRRRSSVEGDERGVQILACGAQVHAEEVFLSIRRRQRAQAPTSRDDSARIWQGCHVHKPTGKPIALPELKRQLLARLRADLHLEELKSRPEPLGIVWTPAEKEPGHLGVFFKVPVGERVAKFSDDKEFRTNGRGYRRESSFVRRAELRPDTLRAKGYTLEEWSHAVLNEKWLP